MNFNVHKRNVSLNSVTKSRQKKQQRSLRRGGQEAMLVQARQIYYSQGNLNEAIRLFQTYLNIYPHNNQALYLCAVSQLRLGMTEEALKNLLNIGDDYEHKQNGMLMAAMALKKIGQIDRSLNMINQCIRRFSGSQEALCFRGKLFLYMKQYSKAQNDFKGLTEKENASYLSFCSLGDCYRVQNKTQKALSSYLQALQLVKKDNKGPSKQIKFKVGLCLYEIQRWKQALQYLQQCSKQGQKSSEAFYYLGMSAIKLGQRQRGLLDLEYSVRLQTNKKIVQKAFKKLIQLFLNDNQYYQALNIVKLGYIAEIDLQQWCSSVQAFMLIIKGNYTQGLKIIHQNINNLKQQDHNSSIKIQKQASKQKKRKSNYQLFDFRKKILTKSPEKAKQNLFFKQKDRQYRKLGYLSTKSVSKGMPKIQSMRLNLRGSMSIKKQQRLKTQYIETIQKPKNKQIYQTKQKQFMYPLLLLFKAYSQFFIAQYPKCLDTYEQYQSFLKDVFGKQSDILYNKTLCEGLLMFQNDMHDEALNKYSSCVDIYFKKYQIIPAQPILYKVILLVNVAVTCSKDVGDDQASQSQILQSTIQLIQNYKSILQKNTVAWYFKSLIYLLLNKIHESREGLQRTLKIAQDCSWKYLYIKGVIQIKLGNYYDAIKQFSAGLILQQRPQLYLGRSISFFYLSSKQADLQPKDIKNIIKSVHLSQQARASDKKQETNQNQKRNDLLVQNCFQDLQKYIQLQSDQDSISLWVSRILFANKAYQQASRSLSKINSKSNQIQMMQECVSIYEGEFQLGGIAGQIIKKAFEGSYLTEQQQKNIVNNKQNTYIPQKLNFLIGKYEKWLIFINLYVKQNYPILIKYLQKQLFECQNEKQQLFLRYNLAIIYLLTGQYTKSINGLKKINISSDNYGLTTKINKIINAVFDQDQCIDTSQDSSSYTQKFISQYLAYKSALIKKQNKQVKIYIRPAILFPEFPLPNLQLELSQQFILKQFVTSAVQKKIQAPWIKKTLIKTVQFTQNLQDSLIQMDRTIEYEQSDKQIQKNL